MLLHEPPTNGVKDGPRKPAQQGEYDRDDDPRVVRDPVSEMVRAFAVGVEDSQDGRRRRRGDGEGGGDEGVVEAVSGGSGGAERGVNDGCEAGEVLVRGRLRVDVGDFAVGSEDVVELLRTESAVQWNDEVVGDFS